MPNGIVSEWFWTAMVKCWSSWFFGVFKGYDGNSEPRLVKFEKKNPVEICRLILSSSFLPANLREMGTMAPWFFLRSATTYSKWMIGAFPRCVYSVYYKVMIVSNFDWWAGCYNLYCLVCQLWTREQNQVSEPNRIWTKLKLGWVWREPWSAS